MTKFSLNPEQLRWMTRGASGNREIRGIRVISAGFAEEVLGIYWKSEEKSETSLDSQRTS